MREIRILGRPLQSENEELVLLHPNDIEMLRKFVLAIGRISYKWKRGRVHVYKHVQCNEQKEKNKNHSNYSTL